MSPTETSTDSPVAESTSANNDKASKNKKADTVSKNNPGKSASRIFLLLILILLGCSAGGYYYWLALQGTLQNLINTNSLQSARLTELSDQLAGSSQLIQAQQESLSQINNLLAEQQSQVKVLSNAQQTLIKTTQNNFDISHRNQRQWILAEVSYLLSLANQRLLVSRDPTTAVAALRSANNRLHDLSDPALLKLRKKIAYDISQLNILKLPDINGIAFSLDNISQAIEALPFKSAQQKQIEMLQTPEPVKLIEIQTDSFFAALWQRISSLVTIKKHNRELQTGVNDLQKTDVDKQLQYRIETSRVALINKNTAVFQLEMIKALSLLSQYYEPSDNRVSALINELTPLTQLSLLPELPDISGSWLLLQKKIKTQTEVKAKNETN